MTAIARKAVELQERLTSLEAELRHWQQEAAAGGPLEGHHTQVHAVAGTLAVPIEALRAALAGTAAPGEAEAMIAGLHRVWDVFRGKLAQRRVVHFAGHLSGADELAHRCYAPAELHGAEQEPPLVFVGDDLSPLTRVRGAAADPLPVPLVGLPWFQVEHLPDLPVVAHEVGHEVEAGLALAPALDAALAGALERLDAPAEHHRAWAAWRAEAFADVFGTLALGPAYTRTLLDSLAPGPASADPDWAPHPPSRLRVLLSAATLELLGFPPAPPGPATTGLEAGVPAVAAALVGGPYAALGDGPLTDLLAFTPEAHERARRTAHDALRRHAPEATDARELVAAARLAFDAAPRDFAAAEVGPRLLRRIRECQTVGARTGPGGPVRAAHARRAGERLTARLQELHGR